MRWWLILIAVHLAGGTQNLSQSSPEQEDGAESRKVLGSSVVTSVSVIMDTGNGSTVFTDAAGNPVSKPASSADFASPVNLLNPDRYEFYTFNDDGELVKRLMTLEEIQGIVASGDDDALTLGSLAAPGLLPHKKVNDVVSNVRNVLNDQIESQKDKSPDTKPLFDTPDVSDSWSMILPAIFGNSGEDLKLPKPAVHHATPDTIMLEPTNPPQYSTALSSTPTTTTTTTTSTTSTTTRRPTFSTNPYRHKNKPSQINVQIINNSKPTPSYTGRPSSTPSNLVQIKPMSAHRRTTTRKPTYTTRPPPLSTTTVPPTRITTFLIDSQPAESATVFSNKFVTPPPEAPTTTYGALSTFFMVNDDFSADEQTTEMPFSTTFWPPQSIAKHNQPTTANNVTFFEQLLLSTTHINEINSELSEKSAFTLQPLPAEEPPTTTTSVPTNVVATATTTTESTTLNAAEDDSSQDLNLISSIEQLISQTVSQTDEPITNSAQMSQKLQQILNANNQTMNEYQEKSATIASDLLTSEPQIATITTIAPSETTELTNTLNDTILEDSLNSLLSQIVGPTEPPQFLTTSTTIDAFTYEPTTDLTTSNTVIEADDRLFTTPPPPPPPRNLINITIIRNEIRKNVTKADLSLEQDFIDSRISELRKNSSAEVLNSAESANTLVSPTNTNLNDDDDNTATESNYWLPVSTVKAHSEPTSSVPERSPSTTTQLALVHNPLDGFGLEDSASKLDEDVHEFVQLCNELAFGLWKSVSGSVSGARGLVLSPFAVTSLLAMVFLGARGSTSDEMNDILRLDDMVTFNPHLTMKNVTDTLEAVTASQGVAVSAMVRQLFSDRSKAKLLNFYKDRASHYYNGYVEEVGFKDIGDFIRRRTNLLVKKHTLGKVKEFLKDDSIKLRAPLCAMSVSIFETDCSTASTEGRDGELHFIVFPSLRQRRLVPIPAVVYSSGFLAGYEPSLDATGIALQINADAPISTIFVLPGQQGVAAPGDGLARLEKRLVESSMKHGAWSRLLRSLSARPGLQVQIPRFTHRSLINVTQALHVIGLKDLFNPHKAQLQGLNGVNNDLYLTDMLQINTFATCGNNYHHRMAESALLKEVYPAVTNLKQSRALDWSQEDLNDDVYQKSLGESPRQRNGLLTLPLPLRPRQARLPDTENAIPRLRLDRPFLYFVRHNPTGLILHMGRFMPTLA